MIKKVYLFDTVTFEFTGTYEAQESPLEPGVYIAPVHATEIAPAAYAAGFIQVFADGVWVSTPDHRGETWYDALGNPVKITTLGAPNATLTAAPPPPTLAQIRDAANAVIQSSIDQKERAGIRCMREVLVKLAGSLPLADPDRVAIEALDNDIKTQRGKLK